jgi:hypothetical protein
MKWKLDPIKDINTLAVRWAKAREKIIRREEEEQESAATIHIEEIGHALEDIFDIDDVEYVDDPDELRGIRRAKSDRHRKARAPERLLGRWDHAGHRIRGWTLRNPQRGRVR